MAPQTYTHTPSCGRKGQRDLERQIRDNTRLEKVAQKQIREAAKRNDMASAKVLAKELVHTRRMTTRLWTNKAHMMSMNSQLTEQLGMVKVAGTLSKSTQVVCLCIISLIVSPEMPTPQKESTLLCISAGCLGRVCLLQICIPLLLHLWVICPAATRFILYLLCCQATIAVSPLSAVHSKPYTRQTRCCNAACCMLQWQRSATEITFHNLWFHASTQVAG